jgi:hypothetical protein
MEAQTVRRIEATENIERADLNPVEEVLVVSRLLESVSGRKADVWTDASPEHLQRVADLLVRSVPWVRDRAYLTRLCPAVQEMVAGRRLPLGQAREIAKLASASEQTQVAKWTVHDSDYHNPDSKDDIRVDSVRHVRKVVAERLSTLRGVPWEPGMAFAGRPACDGCPDNSAHAVLFGIDATDQAPEARCLNLVCYNAKMRAAEAAIRKTIARLKGKKDVAPTASAVRGANAPTYVKPATVARQLAQARGIKPGPSAGAKSGPKAIPYDERPDTKFRNAHGDWKTGVRGLVAAAIVASHERLACFLMAQAGHTLRRRVMSWVATPDEKTRKTVDAVLKRMARARPEDQVALAADITAESLFEKDLGDTPLWIIRRLAGLLDVNLPREPVLDDFLPKAAPETTAPVAEKAKKPKAKKTGRETSSVKMGGGAPCAGGGECGVCNECEDDGEKALDGRRDGCPDGERYG